MVALILTALTIASSEPVQIEAHPDCSLQDITALMYETETGVICINPDAAFRDLIFQQGFEND
ncbi:MAG: hypothetical protein OQK29_01345 [Ignavibacteriaceae bacterium]|nr:hypothetical protein [Ignavibacteriaceae bacterium]